MMVTFGNLCTSTGLAPKVLFILARALPVVDIVYIIHQLMIYFFYQAKSSSSDGEDIVKYVKYNPKRPQKSCKHHCWVCNTDVLQLLHRNRKH